MEMTPGVGRTMKRQRIWLPLCALAVMMVGATWAMPAEAQDSPADYGDSVHVVQPKPVLQSSRVSVTPRFGMTVNDSLYRNFQGGGSLSFHPGERFRLSGVFQWYDFGSALGGPTSAFREINSETGAAADSPYLNWAGGAEVGVSPLLGKLALFNRGVMFYDVTVSAGAMMTESSSIRRGDADTGMAGTLALSTRLFLNDWSALDLELRDVIFNGSYAGGDTSLSHSVTLSLGLSFYLPMGFEYSETSVR